MTEVFAISECFCNYPFLDDGGRGTADDSPGFVPRLSVQYKFGRGPNLDLGVDIQPKFHFVDQQTNDRVRYHRGILEHLSYLTGQSTGETWTRPHERSRRYAPYGTSNRRCVWREYLPPDGYYPHLDTRFRRFKSDTSAWLINVVPCINLI